MLPITYVGLMLSTGEPVDWVVLGLMAIIVLPILVFSSAIKKMEKEFNALSDEEKIKAIAKAAKKIIRRFLG